VRENEYLSRSGNLIRTSCLKLHCDLLICRLVRKLYDHYQIRIKFLEVDDPETMKDLTKKYLELSNLQVPLSDAFNFDPATSVLCVINSPPETTLVLMRCATNQQNLVTLDHI
jgi:hypothetical protein